MDRLQQSGRYTFTQDQALRDLRLSPAAVRLAARRLVLRGRLASPRRGFYVIVPLEYRSAGSPPPSWFIDQLMHFHNQTYYVGLLTAAALHGAAHQQPQEFQVVTDHQLRPTAAGRSRVRFLLKKQTERTAITRLKTETGTMRVATPEATAVDLVRYARHAGGLSNVATVLAELAAAIKSERLASVAHRERDVAAAQRVGYLLRCVGAGEKTGALLAWVRRRRPPFVSLRPDRPTSGASRDPLWRVVVNEKIEVNE